MNIFLLICCFFLVAVLKVIFEIKISYSYFLNKGEAFIETKNLDGETNLKHKTVPKLALKTFLGVDGKEVTFYTKKVHFNP